MVPSFRHPLSRPGMILLGIFAVALMARLIWQAAVTPVDWPDTTLYLADGDSLFAHGRTVSDRYMPLYPILLHLCGPHGILPVQALLSALTAALAGTLAYRLFGSALAMAVAGLMAAFHPVLIFYANMRLTETLFTFLLIASLLAFYERQYLAGSLLMVLGILTRPAVDLIAPAVVLVFSLMVDGETPRFRLAARRLGIYALVYLALMTPWWLHNLHSYGRFVRLDLGDGVMLRLENNPLFDQIGLDFSGLEPILTEFDGLKDPVAINQARKNAALAYVRAHPAHFLWRSIERLGRFWTPVPGSPRPMINVIAALATLPLFVGAAMCLLRAPRDRWRQMAPILLIVLFLSAVHAVSHALPRYRLPVEPLLIVLAAGWYAKLVEALVPLKPRSADRLQ